jgi:adenylate cyclase, class 2
MGPRAKQEIEVKIRVGDAKKLRSALRAIGARELSRVFERNVLHDTRTHDLARQGKLLRLRVETAAPARPRHVGGGRGVNRPARAWLTYKGRGAGGGRYKIREEREAGVADPEAVSEILRGVGLVSSFRYEKYRSTYTLPGLAGVELVLDETPIGVFIELEGAKRQIDRAARLLGYTRADYITASYWQLNRDDCRAHGRPVRDMVFRAT